MPPKKKGKGKSKKKAAAPELTEEEKQHLLLVQECRRLKQLKLAEEAKFNEFQQEKEKLNYFWIVEKKKLEDKKAELRNKERERQDLEEKHQVEIKVYKQRVKHLLYEHQDEVTQEKIEGQTSLKITQDDHTEGQRELKKDERSLKVKLKEMEVAHEDYKRALQQEHDKQVTELRLDYERRGREMHQLYDERMRVLRTRLENKRREDTDRIQERKKRHIKSLMDSHKKAFSDIKVYYNDIIHINLDVIKSLKENVAKLKAQEAQNEKLMFEISADNRKMSEPLERALADVNELRQQREAYRRDLKTLERVKQRLLTLEDKLANAKWEHEVLQQRYDRLQVGIPRLMWLAAVMPVSQKDRDELYATFQEALYDVQQKAGFRNLLLEKKLAAAAEELEKRDAQLNEIIANANIDPSVLGTVTKRVDEVVETKDATIRELQAELQRLIAAHNRLLAQYERTLEEYGIPVEELGFEPIREDFLSRAATGKAPLNSRVAAGP